MASHSRTSPDPQTPLHRLLWAPQNSLTTWASDAACVVIDQLPVGIERAGYRHDVSVDAAGVVTHELVDLESSLPVCLMYERRDGSRIAGFCQPWPAILLRFVEAILDRDLLATDDPSPVAASAGRVR